MFANTSSLHPTVWSLCSTWKSSNPWQGLAVESGSAILEKPTSVREKETRRPPVGPYKWAAACPMCGVGSRRSLASETRSSSTAATASAVCVAAMQRWFLTTSMAGDVSQIPEHGVTDAECHHPVAPCLGREPSPCQCWPPAVAASLTQGPPLPAWQRVPERQNGTKSSCLHPCVPAGHVPCPCVPVGSAAQPCWSSQGLTGHNSPGACRAGRVSG